MIIIATANVETHPDSSVTEEQIKDYAIQFRDFLLGREEVLAASIDVFADGNEIL